MDASKYDVKRIDHLGLVAGFCKEIGFVSRTLHVYPEHFNDIPTEKLLGEGILPQHINDDVLGRFLDSIYAAGV